MLLLQAGAGSDKASAANTKPMFGCVRPRHFADGHGMLLANLDCSGNALLVPIIGTVEKMRV
jgi:hypothetical protein